MVKKEKEWKNAEGLKKQTQRIKVCSNTKNDNYIRIHTNR